MISNWKKLHTVGRLKVDYKMRLIWTALVEKRKISKGRCNLLTNAGGALFFVHNRLQLWIDIQTLFNPIRITAVDWGHSSGDGCSKRLNIGERQPREVEPDDQNSLVDIFGS